MESLYYDTQYLIHSYKENDMKSTTMPQRCFIVEGNIGAGKSTFLKMIKNYLNIQTVTEPHEQWQNVGDGNNLLELFYKDPKRWAYSFQSYAFVSRIAHQQSHARINPYPSQLLERSIYSDRYCFAANCYELGYMNALEWKMYQEWFASLTKSYGMQPDGFIYLRTKPETCFARLQKRRRHEEAQVSLAYIKRLHDKHEAWLINKDGIAESLKSVPVLVLDCDEEFETSKAEQEHHIEKVGSFILSLLPGGSHQSPLSPLST